MSYCTERAVGVQCCTATLLMRSRVLIIVVLGASAMWCSLPPQPSSAAEGLLGHWTFDGVEGGRAADASRAGRHALVHGATSVDGQAGKALAFDGRDDYVALGDLGVQESATIAFWMRGQDVGKNDDWQGLVTSDDWEEGVFHVGVREGSVSAILHLGDQRRAWLRSPTLENDRWYHVAVVTDRQGRTIRLFLNGQEEDAFDFAGEMPEIKLRSQVAGRESVETEPSRFFRGTIDEVRIYGRALAEPEVRRLCPGAEPLAARDPRDIRTGYRIPDEGYCDQPYVVITNDGNWLCLLTTAGGHEGAANSRVVSTISEDQGRTWSKLVELEPVDGPPAVYSLPVVARSGRVYAFYNYNGDNFQCPGRSDCVGWFVYKYSDDNGRTWSKERYRLPMRMTAVDRTNTFDGKVQIFWGIGKPITFGDSMMFAFSKCGKYLIDRSEGWFYRSDNILTEPDVNKIEWQLLPDGDVGLKKPEYGEVQAEQNIVPMSDGSIYCMYRTAGDHPCHAYSRDGGHTWTMPQYATYTPGGRRFKNSRACPKVWRTSNGKYLFWFHHHGAHNNPYRGRNPAWLSGGIEKDGFIHWSQPEIVLYDLAPENCLFDPETGIPGPGGGMSYPDLIEQDGRYWITETQKTVARVHPIDTTLLEDLWNQGTVKTVAKRDLALDLGPDEIAEGEAVMPTLPSLAQGGGFSIDFWIKLNELAADQIIADSRDASGKGFVVKTAEHGTIRIEMSDGRNAGFWACDRCVIKPDTWHHVAIIVDGGPDIISFVVDGILCDGGTYCIYGWGRFTPELNDVSGSKSLRRVPSLDGQLKRLRVYRRYLRTSEAVANYLAETGEFE